jgi:hypothetical protein
MNPIFADLPTTVFEVMSRLARDTGAVNLGQGFPDDPGPEDVRRKAAEAVVDGWNQYPPMLGLPELHQAVARHYGHWHVSLSIPTARSWSRQAPPGARRRASPSSSGRRGGAIRAYVRRLSAAGAAPAVPRTSRPAPHSRLTEEELAPPSRPRRAVVIGSPLNQRPRPAAGGSGLLAFCIA